MKIIYILLAALFVGVAEIRAQENTPLHFDITEWSFGDIREEGGAVSHIFEFTNGDSTPIAIDRVATSCGCTTPEYPRGVVEPGEKARINVTFDPNGMPGEFSKSITVVSGGGKYRDILLITGRVVPRPKTIEEEYPYDMGGGLRVSSTLLTFRSLSQGRVAEMTANYVNTSDKEVTLALEQVEQSGLLNIEAPESVCAGCRGAIVFTYDLTVKIAYGDMYDVVRPVVDGAASEKTIYTSATGIDDFEGVDVAVAPRLFLDASFHNFGEIRQRTVPYTIRLVASNQGAEVLHIRSVSEAEGFRSTLSDGMTIAPGKSLPFEVVLYSNRYSPGEVQGSIRLVVDDPMRPIREIRIAAIIK